jgi:tetratricopeptide (TPR) repeat protein
MSEILQPEQIKKEAQDAYKSGDYQAASQAFGVAAEGYRLAGDLLNAAEMDNNRSVALLKVDDPAGALCAVEGTDLVFAEAGDVRRQAMALGNRAAALEALDRFEEALSDYEKCAEYFKEIGEHEMRAVTLKSISTLQLRTGHSMEALASMQAGVSAIERPGLKHRLLKKLLDIPSKLLNR